MISHVQSLLPIHYTNCAILAPNMRMDKSKSQMCSFFKGKLGKIAEHWTHDVSIMYTDHSNKI